MRSFLLFLLIICLSSQVVIGASFSNAQRQEVLSKMRKDNSAYYKKCSAIAENFKYDSRFSNHLRSSCTDFESERERVLSIIYPNNVSSLRGSDLSYIINKANLSAKMNASKLNSYKEIISEYCKYNSAALAKKDPQACTRVNSLFKD